RGTIIAGGDGLVFDRGLVLVRRECDLHGFAFVRETRLIDFYTPLRAVLFGVDLIHLAVAARNGADQSCTGLNECGMSVLGAFDVAKPCRAVLRLFDMIQMD